MSKMETLELEVRLPNESDEEIKVRCELWGNDNRPTVTVEVPAYEKQPRRHVMMTLHEFDAIVACVNKFRKLLEIANG